MNTYLKYASGDEVAIGIMGKHIMENGIHPYFLYGQHYDGGTTIQAHLNVIHFMLFGVNSFSFHLTNLIILTIFIIVFYSVVKKIFNEKIAFLASLLFAITPGHLTTITLSKGHYVISFIINIFLVFLFYQITFKKKQTYLNYILLGVLTAISWWILEFVIPLIVTYFLVWFAENKLFFFTKKFMVFLVAFIIGNIPLLYYNITYGFANIKQLVAGTFLHKFVCDHNLLPKMVEFGGRTVDHCKIFGQTRFPNNILKFLLNKFPLAFGELFLGWFFYIALILASVYLIYINKKHLKSFILSLFSKKHLKTDESFKTPYILTYFFLFLLLFVLSGFSDPTHFSPLLPLVCIIFAVSIFELSKRFNKIIAALVILVLLLLSLISNINLITSDPLHDLSETIGFLEENNINRIYSTFFIKWRIIFETNEEIIASCDHLCPCGYRYPPYEQVVEQSDNFAYVIKEKSTLNLRIKSYLEENNTHYKEKKSDNLVIYYDISPRIRPSQMIESCIYQEGAEILEVTRMEQ